ncbi:MAG: cell division protein FtsZ, partial [Candidatus Omnitrophota bacterium]|nr:cell division protein FtsZ [Candidatus Omnitrophota bacterium]
MQPKIKVIGVGGSGSNTVSRMACLRRQAKLEMQEVELLAVNTDAQALYFSKADKKLLIGKDITKGLGTGMNVDLGRKSAEESKQEILENLKGPASNASLARNASRNDASGRSDAGWADMVFVTCGLGGGTGSGAAPIIAEISKGLGILTIAVVTTPFFFEGEERKKVAEEALKNLKGKVDSLLVISNDKLLKIIDEKTTVSNAFSICDDVLREAVLAITDLILVPGIINIDFASVLSIMKNSGQALFGVGKRAGENRAVLAAESAINSPLL